MTTPTRDIDASAPRIRDKTELVQRIASGAKPASEWRVGTEHEKFGFIEKTLRPLPYDGPVSIRRLLEGLSKEYGWSPIYEGDAIIGGKKGLASLSLEPGGQFELSGAPLTSIHETCK